MRLTLHTDYALRVLVHVGLRPGALTTINDIAAEHAISKNHLTKVVHQLGRAGYLETVRGKYGGVRLRVDASSVRIGQLVRRVEDDFALARCMRDAPEEDCLLDSSCVARHAFSEGLEAFFATLDHYTLADMIRAEQNKSTCKAACG
jgi:Rrf2 family nitric oxide-sensitive transcriptional repressor